MALSVPDHETLELLRDVPGQRLVLKTRAMSLGVCTTRVLTGVRVHQRYADTVRAIATAGRGSPAGLPEEVALTLEGYRVAARLHRSLWTGVVAAPREHRVSAPLDGAAWSWRPGGGDEDPDAAFSGLRWSVLPVEARWDWRTDAVDAGITPEGYVYVATRFVPGEPVSALPEATRTASGFTIAWNVALLLAELHSHNVAYGDLKAANLVLTPTGRIVLIDLDTLREVGGPGIPARTRDATKNWAAPEQLKHQETWLASDLWAYARLLDSLWPQGLPPALVEVRRACRNTDPLRRPNTRSLLARMTGLWLDDLRAAGRYGLSAELGRLPLQDWLERETPGPAEPPTNPLPEPVGGPATDRLPEGPLATDRVPEHPVETERVETDRVAEVEWSPDPPPPLPVAVVRPEPRGCLPGFLKWGLLGGLGATVLLLVGLIGWQLSSLRAADEAAAALVERLKVHKTDPKKNTDAEVEAIREAAELAWAEAQTPRTCAVRALSTVWAHGWHRDPPWNATRYAEDLELSKAAACGMEREVLLARATLYTSACLNRDGAIPSFNDCTLALKTLDDLELPADEAWHWLRVESLWQQIRVRRTLARRYADTGNAEKDAMLVATRAACEAALPILGWAPVNGPELLESCLPAAGLLQDLDLYLSWSQAMLSLPLPSDTSARRYRLGHLYRDWEKACATTQLTRRKSAWDVTGPPWCVALGHAARGCHADALRLADDNLSSDPAHPWAALQARITGVASSCIE